MVIVFMILFKVAYFATQSIDSPMAVILCRGYLFNKLFINILNPTWLQPRVIRSYARKGWYGRRLTRRDYYSVPRRPTSLLRLGAICPQESAVFPLITIKTCSIARQEICYYLNSVILGLQRRSASCFASNVPTVSPSAWHGLHSSDHHLLKDP